MRTPQAEERRSTAGGRAPPRRSAPPPAARCARAPTRAAHVAAAPTRSRASGLARPATRPAAHRCRRFRRALSMGRSPRALRRQRREGSLRSAEPLQQRAQPQHALPQPSWPQPTLSPLRVPLALSSKCPPRGSKAVKASGKGHPEAQVPPAGAPSAQSGARTPLHALLADSHHTRRRRSVPRARSPLPRLPHHRCAPPPRPNMNVALARCPPSSPNAMPQKRSSTRGCGNLQRPHACALGRSRRKRRSWLRGNRGSEPGRNASHCSSARSKARDARSQHRDSTWRRSECTLKRTVGWAPQVVLP